MSGWPFLRYTVWTNPNVTLSPLHQKEKRKRRTRGASIHVTWGMEEMGARRGGERRVEGPGEYETTKTKRVEDIVRIQTAAEREGLQAVECEGRKRDRPPSHYFPSSIVTKSTHLCLTSWNMCVCVLWREPNSWYTVVLLKQPGYQGNKNWNNVTSNSVKVNIRITSGLPWSTVQSHCEILMWCFARLFNSCISIGSLFRTTLT